MVRPCTLLCPRLQSRLPRAKYLISMLLPSTLSTVAAYSCCCCPSCHYWADASDSVSYRDCVCLPSSYVQLYCSCDFPITRYISSGRRPLPPTLRCFPYCPFPSAKLKTANIFFCILKSLPVHIPRFFFVTSIIFPGVGPAAFISHENSKPILNVILTQPDSTGPQF